MRKILLFLVAVGIISNFLGPLFEADKTSKAAYIKLNQQTELQQSPPKAQEVVQPQIPEKISDEERKALLLRKFTISTDWSKISDCKNVYVGVVSNTAIKDNFGRTIFPELWMRCQENKTEMYVDFKTYLGIEKTEVLTRIEKEKAKKENLNISSDRKGVFFQGTIPLLKKLYGKKLFLVGVTPYGENPILIEFNIEGIEFATRFIKDACNWK